MNETVDGLPPVSLSVSGQVAKQWKREASRLIQLLVWATSDLCHLLELTVTAENYTIQENLNRNIGGKKSLKRHF